MNNIRLVNVFAIAFVLLAVACQQADKQKDGQPVVARAGNHYLYKEDLSKVLPVNYTAKDSAAKAQAYIDHWLKNKLLLLDAENKLSDEEKDIQEKLDNYRMKLLIHKYKEKYVNERMDTTLTKKELYNYYKNNQENFLLNSPYFKGIVVKLPVGIDDTRQLENALKRYTAEDSSFVEQFCYKHVENYSDYRKGWFSMRRIKFNFPLSIDNPEEFVQYRRFYTQEDSLYKYYVKIQDYKLQSDVTPFRIIKDDIRRIILSQRRVDLIRELEQKLYRDAVKSEKAQVYDSIM